MHSEEHMKCISWRIWKAILDMHMFMLRCLYCRLPTEITWQVTKLSPPRLMSKLSTWVPSGKYYLTNIITGRQQIRRLLWKPEFYDSVYKNSNIGHCAEQDESMRHFRLLPLSKYDLPSSEEPGSSVGIATGYRLDGSGIESRRGRDFPPLSRPVLGHTQPPVQWVPSLSRGNERPGRDADPSPLLVPWSRKSRAIYLLPYGP